MDSLGMFVYDLSHVSGNFLPQHVRKVMEHGSQLLVSFPVLFPLELYLGGKIVRSKSFCIRGVALCHLHSHTQTFSESLSLGPWMVHFPLLAHCVSSRNSSHHTEYVPDQRQMIQIHVPVSPLTKYVTHSPRSLGFLCLGFLVELWMTPKQLSCKVFTPHE